MMTLRFMFRNRLFFTRCNEQTEFLGLSPEEHEKCVQNWTQLVGCGDKRDIKDLYSYKIIWLHKKILIKFDET